MVSLSSETDSDSAIILDTSAAISLISSGYAAEILRSLPMRIVVADVVQAELEEGRARGRKEAAFMKELLDAGLVEIASVSGDADEIFARLVVGPAAATLDDGEAATIAIAMAAGATAVIDERKATRICREQFSDLALACTIDLFAHSSTLAALGQATLVRAVMNALTDARMRVPEQHVGWVVNLIGMERARLCSSLPRSARLG